MHEITNLANAPQDLETMDGVMRLPAMGKVSGEFTAEYLAALEGCGMYIVEAVKGAPKPVIIPPAVENIDDLRATAESLGIEVDGRWGEKRLLSEIAKAS